VPTQKDPPADGLRVLVAADDALARAGLAALLRGEPPCQVVGTVALDASLPDALAAYRPRVIAADLGADPVRAADVLALLDESDPPVLALAPASADAATAWAAGARGVVSREADGPRLAAALVALDLGLVVADPELAAGAGILGPDARSEAPVEPLTPRELEVLRLVAEGLPNKAIADRLDITEHTVKFHVNAVLGKLGAQSRTEAAMRAARLGLIVL